jgi:hypothetical protein
VYDPRSKGAESYIRLAKEIIERQPALGALASAKVEVQAEPMMSEEHKGEAAVEEIATATAEMDKSA